jgi:hypothetical protein
MLRTPAAVTLRTPMSEMVTWFVYCRYCPADVGIADCENVIDRTLTARGVSYLRDVTFRTLMS